MSAPDSSLLGLAEASQAASRQCDATVAYRQLWHAVLDGKIPAVRIRNRWYIARQDLPLAAKVLGVAAPAAPEETAAAPAASA